MKETEKILKELEKHLDELNLESEEEINAEIQKFMEKLNNNEEFDFEDSPEFQSDEILEEAYEAETEKEAKKLAKKALEIYPDNIDAQTFLANMEENPVNRLKKLDWTIENARKNLEKKGLFDKESIGVFWGIIETRPYMRARNFKVETLLFLGRYKEAIKECEELLELCESDNLGIRYKLIGLYCFLEEFDKCEKIFKKYNEESSFMLFPMAIMYYKKGDYKKTKKMLERLDEVNPYVIDYMKNEKGNLGKIIEYYAPGSREEAEIVYFDLFYLVTSVPSFHEFVVKEMK